MGNSINFSTVASKYLQNKSGNITITFFFVQNFMRSAAFSDQGMSCSGDRRG